MVTNSGKEYKHRIGKAVLKLVDSYGTSIKNKEVTVRQRRHKFQFGCGEFSAIRFVNNEFEGEEKERVEVRLQKFVDLFNYATLPFYWGLFEAEKGKPQTESVKRAAQWLTAKGLRLKGHPLCWHTVTCPWLLDMSNQEILKAQIERINREVSDFAGLIDIWDVINEVVIMPIFDKYDNGITRICKQLGRINLVREVFSAAKKANPNAVLLINDFNTSESYDILVEGLLEAGVPIDAIGIQSHMHQGYWGGEKTLEVLERFSRFKLPIHFTENTLVSGHIMPQQIEDLNDYKLPEWPTTTEGEERQAREAVTHYKTLFAHPAVESITWWDFVDESWLGAPAGFITRDNRLKPVYGEIYNLVKGEWWTKELHLVTDDNGLTDISGFLGEYEVIFDGKGSSFALDNSSELITLSF